MNRLLLLLGIALLVVLTSWLTQRQEKADAVEKADTDLPDYFIKDFNSTETGVQGHTNQQLDAALLYHYPDTDLTTLEQPDITVIAEDGTTWHATAEHGELNGGEERKLMLRDNVVLRQLGDDSLTLNTDWLRIDSQRRHAETDAPVTIKSSKGRIEGVGLDLYGDEQRLLVRSSVRGQYEVD